MSVVLLRFYLQSSKWAKIHHFLEHWNRKKIFLTFNKFFMSTWWENCKKRQNKIFHGVFFKSTLSVLRCTWTDGINLKIFLGYNINYLSIWPFICHPWFPTRKASKLTFICFQHQVLNTLQGLDNWSWKQINVSFEAFLVGNQVDMKNVVKFSSDFFPYFEALYTNSENAGLKIPVSNPKMTLDFPDFQTQTRKRPFLVYFNRPGYGSNLIKYVAYMWIYKKEWDPLCLFCCAQQVW